MPGPCHVPPRDASVPARDAWHSARASVYHCGARACVVSPNWHASCGARGAAGAGPVRECSRLSIMPFLTDSRDIADATQLIAAFGDDAGFEAAARADKSRDLGNHVHFCRWRQIERLIVLMSVNRAVGTVH